MNRIKVTRNKFISFQYKEIYLHCKKYSMALNQKCIKPIKINLPESIWCNLKSVLLRVSRYLSWV